MQRQVTRISFWKGLQERKLPIVEWGIQGQDWHPRCSSFNLNRAATQSPKATGRITLLRGQEAVKEGKSAASVRKEERSESRGSGYVASHWLEISPQTRVSENTWTLAGMTAPHEGLETAIRSVLLGNRWLADWGTHCLVYRHSHKAPSGPYPYNYTEAMGERRDRF